MKNTIKLTSLTKSSGCAAKIGPAILDSVLCNLPIFENPNLLVGFDKKMMLAYIKFLMIKFQYKQLIFSPQW